MVHPACGWDSPAQPLSMHGYLPAKALWAAGALATPTACRLMAGLRVSYDSAPCAQDGKSIVSGWCDGKIRAFGPQSGKLLYTINDAHHKGVTAIAAAADSERLISGGGEGERGLDWGCAGWTWRLRTSAGCRLVSWEFGIALLWWQPSLERSCSAHAEAAGVVAECLWCRRWLQAWCVCGGWASRVRPWRRR